ncbi:MAG: hypothetical protein H6817_04400 [Phycisphaerales bacterium]|nr:hypothetical protein [Phycisphaerales bacterium]
MPAFPQGLNTGQPVGLSKREYMAVLCLQGILSNKGIQKLTIWSASQSAVMYADQLLATLEGKTPEDNELPEPDGLPYITDSAN